MRISAKMQKASITGMLRKTKKMFCWWIWLRISPWMLKTAISPDVELFPMYTPDTRRQESEELNWENCVNFQLKLFFMSIINSSSLGWVHIHTWDTTCFLQIRSLFSNHFIFPTKHIFCLSSVSCQPCPRLTPITSYQTKLSLSKEKSV